ncbi:MAG: stage III sporulation protein AF [Clostridia bacterium]
MVAFISSWAQGIVVAVIIATIIEMIAPEGHSKKYIKVVIGIYVLFQIVSPVLEKVTNKSFAISSIINWENDSNTMQSNQSIGQTLENVNQSSVQEIYVSSLQADIKTKIQEKGYIVKEIQIEVDNQTEGYPLKKIQLQLENNEKTKEEQTKSEDSKSVTINEIMNIEIMVHKDKSITDEQTQQTKKLTTQEEKDLKTYLSDTYSINAKYITIT